MPSTSALAKMTVKQILALAKNIQNLHEDEEVCLAIDKDALDPRDAQGPYIRIGSLNGDELYSEVKVSEVFFD